VTERSERTTTDERTRRDRESLTVVTRAGEELR